MSAGSNVLEKQLAAEESRPHAHHAKLIKVSAVQPASQSMLGKERDCSWMSVSWRVPLVAVPAICMVAYHSNR